MYPLVAAIFKFNLTMPKALDLCEKLVQPIILYGSEVWTSFSPHQRNFISKNSVALLRYCLESPVNRPKLQFCKQILGLKRNSPSLAVYGELGIISTAHFFLIDTYYYNNDITFYHTNSNYYTTLQELYHGERKDNDYPMANKKTRNIKLTNNYTTS